MERHHFGLGVREERNKGIHIFNLKSNSSTRVSHDDFKICSGFCSFFVPQFTHLPKLVNDGIFLEFCSQSLY